jgi:hypothetical protein
MEAVVAVLHKKEEKKSKVCLTSSYLLLANGKLLTSCFTIKLLIKNIYIFSILDSSFSAKKNYTIVSSCV